MKSIFLSKKEVARKFNISPSTVFRWANDGIIPPPIRLGPNTICWDENELDDAIEEKKKDRGFLGHSLKRKNNVNKTQRKATNSCSFTCLWR